MLEKFQPTGGSAIGVDEAFLQSKALGNKRVLLGGIFLVGDQSTEADLEERVDLLLNVPVSLVQGTVHRLPALAFPFVDNPKVLQSPVAIVVVNGHLAQYLADLCFQLFLADRHLSAGSAGLPFRAVVVGVVVAVPIHRLRGGDRSAALLAADQSREGEFVPPLRCPIRTAE
ncbi:MAG: hypothetical protein WC734_05460 [Patescibacteria group bacterium]